MISLMGYLDWFGYFFLFYGIMRVGQPLKKNWNLGWFYQMVGSFLMIIFGLSLKKYGIVGGNLIFFCLALINWINSTKIYVIKK